MRARNLKNLISTDWFRIISDFILIWIDCKDRKKAWSYSKLINNKKNYKDELEIWDITLMGWSGR